MQSFLSKCAAVGIVAGGFALTGDLGRLAARGQRLIDARTVPSETAADPGPASVADGGSGHADALMARPRSAAKNPGGRWRCRCLIGRQRPCQPAPQAGRQQPWLMPGDAPADAPVGRAFTVPAPPTSGPDGLDLRQLTAGSRVLVWVRRPAAATRGSAATDLIALDIIDPKSAEALEHRHAALTHGSQTTTVHAAARRVVIAGDASGRIARGSMLGLAPLHGVNGLGPVEKAGTIVALDLQGR